MDVPLTVPGVFAASHDVDLLRHRLGMLGRQWVESRQVVRRLEEVLAVRVRDHGRHLARRAHKQRGTAAQVYLSQEYAGWVQELCTLRRDLRRIKVEVQTIRMRLVLSRLI